MNIDETIPQNIHGLVLRGYRHRDEPPVISADERESVRQRRHLARRWRNLLGEAKYDIPRDLWPYINMSMPKEWHMCRHLNIKKHFFVIKLPGFLPLSLEYRQYVNGNDWYFHCFEIKTRKGHRLASAKYEDLALFLALAHELGKTPARQEVKIEEIQVGGDLADNARVVKPRESTTLTMEDFYNESPYNPFGVENLGGA